MDINIIRCYICLETDAILKKSCNNLKCTAKVHEECLQSQVRYRIFQCGICRGDVNVSFWTKYVIRPLDIYFIFICSMIIPSLLLILCENLISSEFFAVRSVIRTIYLHIFCLFYLWHS